MFLFRFTALTVIALALLTVAIAPTFVDSPAAQPPAPNATLPPTTVGRYTVAWNPADGLHVAVDGVPVIRESSLYIVKAGWSGVLLDQSEATPVVSGWSKSGAGQTAKVTLENADAVCTYTFTIAASGEAQSLDVSLAYRLKRDVPAEIEYAAGYLSGNVLTGATFAGNAAETPLAVREISVAPPPAKNTQEQNRLSAPFTDIRLGTRLGTLQIIYSGTAPRPVLFDARSETQDWATTFPVFWLGVGSPAPAVKFADGEKTAHFQFVLGPAGNMPHAVPAVSGETVTRNTIVPDAFVPGAPRQVFAEQNTGLPLVIPTPKKITLREKGRPFRLNPQTKIVLCDDSAATKQAATLLQTAIHDDFALSLPLVTNAKMEAGPINDEKNAIYIGLAEKSMPMRAQIVTVPQKPEGYGAHVPYFAGRDAAGVLWAAQTAIQLLEADTTGPFLPPVVIEDWPTLAVRGVHLFHGKNALPFHEKLIDRVFSRFKLNTLVIQAEQVRWKHDAAVAPDWAGTPEDIKKEVAYAKAHGITVYPLVQSYGHMEWLFTKPQNKDFAEDPETPYAVNFTNPAAVRYLEGFNAEADETFAAPAFHIGLDEVTMRGHFPDRSAPRTFPDLFITAATHWHNFFKKRGKQTWMWADMALHPSEVEPSFGTAPTAADAAKVRAGLPKDIVMIDWQYGGQKKFPSLKKLKDAGFTKIIAATWFNPANIHNFSRAAAEIGAYGALQTTWCGYESSEAVLATKERRQFEAMVLAAEYFWNGGGTEPDKLPYSPVEVFARQWRGPQPTDFTVRGGWTLNLETVGTRPLADFVGFGPQNRLQGLPSEPIRLADGTLYKISERPILLHGKLNPNGDYPTTLTLPTRAELGRPAQSLCLVLAASHHAAREMRVGTITATFSDGTTQEIPLLYGKNIAAWDDSIGLAENPVVWRGTTVAGQPAFLRRLSIVAPAGKSVSSVQIVSEDGESAPLIFAATVLGQ